MSRPTVPQDSMNHVLIISLSRSGGKLLRMLFDGHTELNAFPFEHWHRGAKGKFPARRIAEFASLSSGDKLATAGAGLAEKKIRSRHGEALAAEVMGGWREDMARAATLPDLYASFARRYFAALGAVPWLSVVNHCGGLCRLTGGELDAVYGKGTHVITIRDPRAVFVSMEALRHRKFTIRRVRMGKVSASRVNRHIEKSEPCAGVSGYLREFCEDYRHMMQAHVARPEVVRVRFEDLVTAPEATTREICARLGLRWEPILLTPTQFGTPRAANSSYRRQSEGIVHQQAAGDWVARIPPAACQFIEENLAAQMNALGYRPLGSMPSAAPGLG